MCSKFAAISTLSAAVLFASSKMFGAAPAYAIEQAVAVAQERNPEILIARKKVLAARGSFIEARSGFLPSLTSSGLSTMGSLVASRTRGKHCLPQGISRVTR